MCGLFGIVAYREVSDDNMLKLATALGKASETRGTHAGGFSFVSGGKIFSRKNSGAITKNGVFDMKDPLHTTSIMGHTRMTTQGVATHIPNNHPFVSKKAPWMMAHNGVLSNDAALRKKHDLPVTDIATDSYVVVQMLDKLHNGLIDMETLADVSEQLQGTYNLTFHTKGGVWLVKHNNPLAIVNCEEIGAYIYASTKEILYEALDKFYDGSFVEYLMTRNGGQWGEVITLNSGDIFYIKHDGSIEKGHFTPLKSVVYTPTTTYYGSRYSRGYDSYYDSYDDYPTYADSCQRALDTQTEKESHAIVVKETETPIKKLLSTLPQGNISIIFNGNELEPVSYVTKCVEYDKDKGAHVNRLSFYSAFKGKQLTVDDNRLVGSVLRDDMFFPVSLDDCGVFYDQNIYTSFMQRFIKESKVYRAVIESFKLANENEDTKPYYAILLQVFYTLLYTSFLVGTQFNVWDDDSFIDPAFKDDIDMGMKEAENVTGATLAILNYYTAAFKRLGTYDIRRAYTYMQAMALFNLVDFEGFVQDADMEVIVNDATTVDNAETV